ncbi:hypothetical protein OG230_18985 [Streptomyces sp. NBC_00234]|uniref:hypothetical protein n=1 Tax=Streptomyces sp. NBC_00234 TaxID=2903638 RepID=UPI002E2BB706|nr:hypothetical protein [Streptomyces sp. NBC_00234]
MSRTQWCCLMAVLTVVLGLFCGPATASVTPESAGHPVVAADSGRGVPGCGRDGGHDGTEPGAPVRGRAAHDQAPGLAEWGLPAATGAGPAEPLVRVAVTGPEPATPTPIELSVLRV